MTRRKSFNGAIKISDFEPLEFDLANDTFKCNPAVPGSVLLKFARESSAEDSNAEDALYNFFKRALPEDEYARFRETIDSTEVIIPVEEIADIASWLLEQYGERPTKRSEVSSDTD